MNWTMDFKNHYTPTEQQLVQASYFLAQSDSETFVSSLAIPCHVCVGLCVCMWERAVSHVRLNLTAVLKATNAVSPVVFLSLLLFCLVALIQCC